MAETYDPKTIQLQGRDYLEVAQRVLWLRREHPDAQIITDITYHDPGEGFVLVRAVVTIPNGGTATGHGTAKRGGRGPAAERWVEFAETRAIGRACAALGYGTLAALDEDSDPADAPTDTRRAQPPQEPRNGQQATPNTPHAPNAARPPAGGVLTPDQQATIRNAVAALGWGAPDCTAYLKQFGVARFGELSQEQAAEVIPDLLSKAAEIEAA